MSKFRPEEQDVVYIGEGVTMKGAIHAQDVVVVDGVVEGEIICGELIVGANGVVEGTITVSDADIYGKIGTVISVKQLLVVRSTGRVEGKWVYGEIAVEKGGLLSGSAESTGFQAAEGKNRKDDAPAAPANGKPELFIAASGDDEAAAAPRASSLTTRALRDRKRLS